MNFGFITALTSFEQEDLVVDSLVSRDFSLLLRSMHREELFVALESLNDDNRVIVIIDELFGLTSVEISKIRSEQIACLQIPVDAFLNAVELNKLVDECLRKPELSSFGSFRSQGSKKWIAFTGSAGSPGISTVTLNVASELSLLESINLIDCDPVRRDLGALLGVKTNDQRNKLHSQLLLMNPRYDDSLNALEEIRATNSDEISCIDLGEAPAIHELITDRRNSGKRYLEALLSCGQIVYIVQPEAHSIYEMENFARDAKDAFPGIPISFVLNKAGTSNRQQAMQKRFRNKAEGAHSFLIPRENAIIDRAQGRYATVVEISPRSSLRKSLKQLAVQLSDFF